MKVDNEDVDYAYKGDKLAIKIPQLTSITKGYFLFWDMKIYPFHSYL